MHTPRASISAFETDDYAGVRATFEDEVTIHIYSLEPGPLEVCRTETC